MNTKFSFRLISLVIIGSITLLSSCTSVYKSMREPNSRVDFTSKDFTFSEQQSAEAQVTKIIGIDWKRLFKKELGNIEKDQALGISLSSIPVIGTYLTDRASNYALYNLMQANPGYDVVFYPQYERTVKHPIIIPIYTKTTVTVKARLAKIKTN
jgi:hypothetical protein